MKLIIYNAPGKTLYKPMEINLNPFFLMVFIFISFIVFLIIGMLFNNNIAYI